MRVCGIDEAGRGPVIGPMTMAGVVIEDHKDDDLREMGVKDSKLLSAEERNRLAHSIENQTEYEVKVLSPQVIDAAVDGSTMNLNLLEAKTSAEIINALKPEKAILDCPSHNTSAYASSVRRYLDPALQGIELVSENKADVNFPTVSAASILAKVRRDAEIDLLKADVGIDFGSGYPSDPKTKEFLKKHYEDYDFFRKSWSSWKVLAHRKNQRNLSDF